MSQPPTSPPATLFDVREGITKLCRDIASLQGEVNELSNLVGRFAKGRNLKRFVFASDLDRARGERESTPEPRSQIQEALRLLTSANTTEEMSLLLRAISRDLDGALRDIRSTKMDVKGIVDDSDLRDEFRAWQDRGD